MAEYKLFFREIEIGVITEEDFDFPRLTGRYSIAITGDESDTHRHIVDYVNYSIEAWKLANDENDTTGDTWDEYEAEHESKFTDLIETTDWHVLKGSEDHCICVPNFGPDGEVIWSWDFSDD